MKHCNTCGERKPLGEFYTNAGMADGRLNRCKECCRITERTRLRIKTHAGEPGMTEEQAMTRLGLSPTERAAVLHCVTLYEQARTHIGRKGRGVGKGHGYEGKTADAVLSKVAPTFARWCVLSQAVRDVARIRNGAPLTMTMTGWRVVEAA